MKVIVAKINKEPMHSLSKSDITFIFKCVPDNWISGIKTVVLAAELFKNSRFDRPVIYSAYSSRLNILSRGLSKTNAAKEVFRELGLVGGVTQSVSVNHIPKNELLKLDTIIKPYLSEFTSVRT